MTPTISIEPKSGVADRTATRSQGFDLAGLIGRGPQRCVDGGSRRRLAGPAFPAGATPETCVAAWHGVLHWLGHKDEPVTTCLVGRRAEACWPIVTRADAHTPLARLLADVRAQWPAPQDDWPDLRDPAHAEWAEALRAHTIRIEAGAQDEAPDFALVDESGAWHSACAASFCGEALQQALMSLWHGLVVALLERPQTLLSEHAHADAAAGMVGPVVPLDGTLAQRLATHAAATPAKPAVVDDHGRIGFAELATLSDAWAQVLRGAGVRRGDHVGLAFGRGRGRSMVAAQLAVLKAGAAFVPMDAEQPAARLQGMADDTDLRLALADAALAPMLQQALPDVHCLVTDGLRTLAGPAAEPATAAGIDDPAYVIFTSGSTGKPKGVKVGHGNLLNFVMHLGQLLDADDVVSQFAPFTFDASVAEIHASVLNGNTLVILSDELINDPDRLQAHMTEQGVTFAAFPPQYAQHLSPARLPRLKTLITAGSAPDHALVARWQPHLRYLNAYGPTETTILSTAWQPARVPALHEPIVIGTPIGNTQVRVANRFDRALPPGVIGELLIGGEGVTHGYLKREALTRDRFTTLDGTRWYRSGDLACLDAEGRLVFAGRVDQQVKLRGHRLEPGEVETALLAIDGIRQAAVAVTDDAGASKQLVAFCVGTPLPEDALRQRLQQSLPAWAMPNRIVWIERLPLTRNGKTDHAALLDGLARARAEASAEPVDAVDPADALEAQVAAIWRNVLQQPRILADDSFIHLGGDSLTALVVTSAVRRLGYAPNSAQLLKHPRLADYVQLLRAQGRSHVESDYAIRSGPAPLAPIQGWFFDLGLSDPGSFCQSLVFDSDDAVDADRLARACARLAEHHDQLRARFVFDASDREWRQEVVDAPIAVPATRTIDVADALLDATGESCCRRLAAELRLDVAPLFRLALIRTPRRSRVVWVLHHLLVDTVSHGVLLDDLHQLYRDDGPNASRVLPGKSVAFGDWAGRLQQRVADEAPRLLGLWRPVLEAVAQAEPLPLARQSVAGAPKVVCEARLTRAETQRLVDDATQCYRQSPEELVLAATGLALARCLDLQRIAIDIEWHGRDDAFAGSQGVDRTVGWFTSVHPLCIAPPAPGESLGPWLMALKEARAAIPHRGREFGALRHLSRDPAVRAAFAGYRKPEVLFNFSGIVQRSQGAWRTVPIAAIEMGEHNANPYAMSFETEIRDGELIVSCYSRPELWPAGAVQRLAQALPESLHAVSRHCGDKRHRRWTPSDFPQLALSQAQVDRLPATTQSACPLTDMQWTMLRHQHVYQVHMCYRIPRSFDEAAWREAVTDWMARHDCLRTHVHEWDDGDACQVVRRDVAPPLVVHYTSAGSGERLARGLLDKARAAPVRVDLAPLFSLDVVDDGGESFLALLSIHHIVHDGWSIELLLDDLLLRYRHRRGEAVVLPAAPLAGMAEVVARQQRLRDDADWRAYFAGLPWAPTACRLPARSQPKAAAGVPGTRLHLSTLAPELVAAVRTAAGERGVTVNSLWLAGYAGLLRMLGGQPQVRCGVVQNGRMEDVPGIETVTGCCVNTLPLVLDVPATATFGEIAATVAAQLERMRAGAAFPLSVIHDAVRPLVEDDLLGSLFNIESRRYGAGQQELRPTLVDGHESTNHPFTFSLIERDDAGTVAYDVRIGHNPERHDADAVARWLEIYASCMQALVATPDEPWHRLQLLPTAQRRAVVDTWNDTRRDYPRERCAHELFEAHAARSPDAIAVDFEGETLSYARLNARANQLAHHLRSLGVGPDARVALCMDRSLEMVVAILATLKAGGAYVPLDPAYPAERLAHMLRDSDPALLLTQEKLRGRVDATGCAVVVLDEAAGAPSAWAGQPECNPGRQSIGLNPSHLAYVIYTSGSTGLPKGVMVEHRGWCNLATWQTGALQVGAASRVLQFSSLSFDAFAWELAMSLFQGASLHIPASSLQVTGSALADFARQHGITHATIPPVVLMASTLDAASLASVGTLITAGEACSAALVQRWGAGRRLFNAYGPTESTVCATVYECSPSDTGAPPIGRPIANTQVYVLDAHRHPVPVGVVGELCIGGDGIARGYLNRAELSAERFVADPFAAEPGRRLYKTGDLARWLDDGNVECLGRIDHQVKVRGFRIELEEIEAQLRQVSGVREAVVLARDDGADGKALVAYVVDDGTGVAPATLRAHLAERLPEYMLPGAFVALATLPLTPNGKLDRQALPAPEGDAFVQRAYAAPEGPTEATLAQLWSTLLGVGRVGRNDHFFELGGHSLLAVKLVAQLRRQLGIGLALSAVFAHPRLCDLAHEVARAAQSQLGAIVPVERGATMPLSFAQQRLWVVAQMDPQASAAYHMPGALRLRGTLDEGALQTALDRIVERHEALRTRFVSVDGRSHAVIDAASGFAMSRQDLTGADAAELQRACSLEAGRPFDFATGPLIRGRLLRLAADDHVLLVTMHHIVSDGWSVGVLMRELAALYTACCEGRPDPLPPLAIQYADYAAWQRRWLQGPLLQQQLRHWVQHLQGAPALVGLPTDRPRTERPDHAGAGIDVELDAPLTQAVKALARRHGTTLFMTMLAAWAAVVARLAGQEQVVIGSPVANRGRTEVEPLIGFFVNTLALKVDLADRPSVADLLAQVRYSVVQAQEHQDVPFEQVVEALKPARSLAHSPLFQLMLAWQDRPEPRVDLGALTLETMPPQQHSEMFDLTLNLHDGGERIAGDLSYATALFDEATVRRHWCQVEAMLQGMVRDDGQASDRIELMTGAQRDQVLRAFNDTRLDVPADALVHTLFERQARQRPNATAVEFGGVQLSYAELDARANQLAHHLVGLGVGPDARVAVCVERGLEMLIGLLATLKAGGAYVPLDPAYPAERLSFMAADSAPVALLTQRSLLGRIDAGAGCRVVVLDQAPWPQCPWGGGPDTDPGAVPAPSNLAYVIYTSGSTGLPKGVAIPHRAVVNFLHGLQREVELGSADRLLAVTTLCFDIAVLELFLPLQQGARVVIASREQAMDGAQLNALLQGSRATVMQATPSTWRLLIDAGFQGPAGFKALCGGEALPPELAEQLLRRCGGLFNLYGPTETTVWSACSRVQPGRPITIGRPIANTQIYVLDVHRQPVPIGVAGELHIAGAGVARGYLNRPELTTERFVADPFSTDLEARMYKTGDLARWRADGTLEFLGRNDFQVKVRGFRIELGEIEAKLAQVPGVRVAVVLAREAQAGGKRLVAYLVGDALDPAALRAGLVATLPDYMVPHAFVVLDAMPQTPNGKIDRARLPEPDASAYAVGARCEPASAAERTLWTVWREVLGSDAFGVTDGFYAVGGDSILAIEMVAKARKQGLALTPRLVVEEETIRRLVARVVNPPEADEARVDLEGDGDADLQLDLFGGVDASEAAGGPSTRTPTPERSPAPAGLAPTEFAALEARYPGCQAIRPCTALQQGLLLFSAREPQSGVYLMQLRLELEGVDPARLRRGWQVLMNRHDVLRSAFVDAGHDTLWQVVCARAELPWREVDFRAPGDDGALDRLLSEDRARPFDVAAAPLMRVLLVRTADDRHCMAWTHHHALVDGWSMGLLMKELFEIYAGAEPPPSKRSSGQAHLEWLQSRDRAAALRYWQGSFDGVDAAAGESLPHARRSADDGAARPRYEQALQTLVLPADASARLTRLARAEGVGLGTLMFAAWGLLLSKYSAEPEVVFGYASSGRSPELAGSESMVGLFIASLPLRLKIDADRTLGAWLKDIQRCQIDHDDHGHLALADIQRCAGVRAGQALFDSLVAVENFPLDSSLLAGAANRPRLVAVEGAGQSDFALNLVVRPGERLRIDLAFRTALFDAETIATLLRRLEQLLAGFADGGSQTLAQLSLLTPPERDRAVRQWNDTATDYPRDRALPALFEATARRREAAPAIVSGEVTWTYGELDRRVRVLSGWLARHGVVTGSRVALSLRKEPALLAAMLAVMRLGAAYVPIALDGPPERRAFLLADAGIRCTVTRRAERDALADAEVLCLEDCPDDIDDGAPAGTDVDPQATAYVIYTSGSTGTPKGVAISHRNVVNFCHWCQQSGLVRAGERTTQFAPFTFDASAGEIFAALLTGAELHLLADALIQDPRALAQYLTAHDIRFAAFPPTYLQQLDPQSVPPGLVLLTAGSAPTPELVQRWNARGRYVNGYGPTETTVLSSAWICERGAVAGRTLSIGRPIANTSLYVVDGCGQLCAPGLIGEICIGGDGVAQGYLNRPDLTERQFVPNPWVEGGRMYRTGDHGRWLDDGSIEFVGRRDRQVKLRGYRIELNEIEGRLRAHSGVADAAVLVRGSGAEQRLLAWVVPAAAPADEAAFVASIREAMRRSMPEYMLPQAIGCLPQLPLTSHGKLDAKALPEPAALAVAGGDEHVPPRTATEARLAAIWAGVLQVPAGQIGATSDFFALGGHSLLAMRTIARVREELGADVDVSELFERPVLGELAAAVDRAAQNALPPIVPIPRDRPLPLSYAQQRLWFLAQMEGVSATYHIPGALRLCGPLDRAVLRRALDRIVARHESLRTRFVATGGEPRQQIDAAAVFALSEHDFRGLADADARLDALMRDEAVAPFDLATGPLIRGRLVQLHEDEHVLQITMHHIVMDAWSLGLLLKELGALYGAFAADADDPLPPLAVQYADYAAWQQQWLAGNPWEAQSDHWRHTLAGAPTLLELPADRPRPAQQDPAGDLVEFAFDAALTAGLKALGRRHGTTLFMTLLAVWSVVLARLSGQRDLVIGSPVANRAQLETEPLIGFFINTLALRIDLTGDPTLAELLQRVKRRVLDAQRHQQLPFEQVVEIVQPPRSLAHTPVFQVMLNWQEQGLGDFTLDGLRATPLRPPCTLSKFDLTLDLAEAGDTIVGGFEYATALFDAATIRRHAGYLRRVVEALVADADQRVQSLDLLGADEHRLLRGFNDTRRPELYDHGWPELFDAQAARTPERIAVRCGAAEISYRELHERATLLAAALAARGAGPGRIVALLDHRGIDLLVTIVAVLKSSAAYLPLDPAHPSQRWLDVLQEAQPMLLWVGESLATEQRWLRRKWIGGAVAGAAELLAAPASPPAALAHPSLDDLAYVLFTSGSTGRPKGVMIEHRGMVNNMRSKFEPLGLGADDVIAQTASQCFDISVWQHLAALLLGAKVLIVGNELTRDPRALLDHLASERVTVWEPVPSVLQAALPWKTPLPDLRWAMPTGEALSRELVARWFEQYPGIPLMNAYGPAECSDDVAFQPLHGPVDRVLIGTPVANAQLHVVDEHLMPLPLGSVGELAVSGPVVGRGYLARPAETQAVFKANPFARDAVDQRLYLTGDLARRWPDGRLEFVGRKDFQLKIRGFRIELGEIESCLARHPAVREAVVDARELGQGDRQLVAYVTLDADVGRDVLLAHLCARLPDYMLPAAVVVLDALPLNANGKVDRRALPEPTPAALARADHEAPCTDTERAIAALWQELLQVPQVGRGDSYFDLGGSSLLLIRMLSRLKDAGMTLGVTDVYQLRTVAACAAAIDAQRRDAAAWPLDDRWRHAVATRGEGGSRRTALLLDRSESPRRTELQALLATVEPTERPDFVRFTDDLDGSANRFAEGGAAARPPATHAAVPRRVAADAVRRLVTALVPSRGDAPMLDALRVQLRHHRDRIAAAPTETTLGFSPIQRNLMAWRQRDAVDIVALEGWHAAAELQRAFGAVAAEQDLLRAAPDGARPQWRLLAADAVAAAPIPVVDLRADDPARADDRLQRIGAELLAARAKARLAYAAAVVSLTDLDHRLLLAVDHLVWDGVSATVLQRRMQQHLRGTATPLSRNYRDHVDATQRVPDEPLATRLRGAIDRDDLCATMDATRRALERRAALPLQVVELRRPDLGGEAADRLFGLFKRCVAQLTGLARYGVVLNHHGRESGGVQWFDQVGLFLDKIPFAAGAGTALGELVARATWLQQHGLHHVGLAQVANAEWGGTLPPLGHEVQFNFQTAAPSPSVPVGAGRVREKLKDFFGIAFDAAAGDDAVLVRCAFRGNAADLEAVRRLLEDRAPDEPAVQDDFSLEVRDVHKRYGDFEAVRGVSFSVRRGRCFGILGPNGAGKTSLLAMIEGLVPITSGSIRLLGMDVATEIDRIQPHVGVQLQQNNYFQFLTVAQLLAFYRSLRSAVGAGPNGRSAESLLERLDLKDKLGFKVDELSGGQKQRLSIAIALLEDPDVIFLDEPTSALDPHSRVATWEFIEELKKDPRRTVILTTHSMEEAERLCDEILLMDRGRVIAQGNPLQLARNLGADHRVQVQFGRAQFRPALLAGIAGADTAEWDEKTDCLHLRTRRVTDTLREVLALSQTACIDVLNVEVGRPTLEDVFLSHTNKELVP